MKNITRLLLGVIITVSLWSCKCDEACTAMDWQYMVVYQGFSDSSVSPLIIKSYAKSSGFSHLIDSTSYSGAHYQGGPNTPEFELYGSDTANYILSLPVSGRSDSLTNVIFNTELCRSCAKHYTIHWLTSYTLNGVTTTAVSGLTTDVTITR